ncbi:acyltransferase [Marinobacter hydrocarbonoclasticus]|nr:acyltransferase [Marinobacter nauticus]
MSLDTLKGWLKAGETPASRRLFGLARRIRILQLPRLTFPFRSLYALHIGLTSVWATLCRLGYYTPLFKARLSRDAPGLYLYSGLPQVSGPLTITLGKNCRVSGQSSLFGRSGRSPVSLTVGDNCDIGWQNTIAVGTRVTLGNNVRLAGRCQLAGFPGHPLDPEQRALGAPETPEQRGPIVLEDDVWLCTGVTVLAGVTIGRGTVVATGSVVTRSLPAGVLAGGIPARVIRPLNRRTSV